MTPRAIANSKAAEDGNADPNSGDEATLGKDDAFHILQNSRRRAVLRFLLEEGRESFVMRDVAEAVAAWEHDTTVDQLSSDQRQRVYISLYQSHLPKLDDANIINYDQDRGVLEPRPPITLLEPFLDDGLTSDEDLILDDDGQVASGDGDKGISSFISLLRK